MSYEKDQFGGSSGGLSSNSASAMIATQVAAALTPYASSNSVSAMIALMLAPYLTSASAASGAQILVLELRTSDPVSPATGQIWLRTDL